MASSKLVGMRYSKSFTVLLLLIRFSHWNPLNTWSLASLMTEDYQIRNPNIEIRNKSKIQIFKTRRKPLRPKQFSFVFVI